MSWPIVVHQRVAGVAGDPQALRNLADLVHVMAAACDAELLLAVLHHPVRLHEEGDDGSPPVARAVEGGEVAEEAAGNGTMETIAGVMGNVLEWYDFALFGCKWKCRGMILGNHLSA